MLGLTDRSRLINLFEAVMRGDIQSALLEFEQQYEMGGDPAHGVERSCWLRPLGDTAQGGAGRAIDDAAADRRKKDRVRNLPHTLHAASDALLADAAQGHGRGRPLRTPLLAAEMVLIRLAHAASLPQGEELVKLAQQAPTAAGARIETAPKPLPRPQLASASNPTLAEARRRFGDQIRATARRAGDPA